MRRNTSFMKKEIDCFITIPVVKYCQRRKAASGGKSGRAALQYISIAPQEKAGGGPARRRPFMERL